MKYIAVLLAFVIFGLSLLPCGDRHTQHNESETTATTHHHNHDHNHSEEEKGGCSPFCSCACSLIKMNLEENVSVVKIITPVMDNYTFFYTFNYSFSYINHVWHPPVVA